MNGPQTALTEVLAARHFEPELRQLIQVPAGTRLDAIIALALPGASESELDRLRCSLVTEGGVSVIARKNWRRVTPKPGVRVVLRVTPAKDSLKTILQIVVTIAAIAIGQMWVGPVFGSTAAAFATAAFTAIGNLLINALIPPSSNTEKTRPNFAISGFRNGHTPDGPIPCVLGRHRMAPPFAATSWTEIDGDLQYVRAVFCLGYGPLEISDLKIGETPFADHDEISWEIRQGLPDDEPLTLVREQVIEEPLAVLLPRPLPRDDYGALTGGASIATPVTRMTARDITRIGVVLAFPAGLVRVDGKGRKQYYKVTLGVRIRAAGSATWLVQPDVSITAKKQEAFYRQLFYDVPERGQYEIEITRETPESDSSQIADRCVLGALQSFRPEYPIATTEKLALLAVRVKATYQLNGALDNVNAVASRICPDFDHLTGTWITRETSNPASLYRFALQGPMAAFPVADAGIDLAALEDFHDHCRENGLAYDRVHDFAAPMADVLSEICAAGRGAPRHDGLKWGVIIDRPQALVVDHVSPRNARDFRWSRNYFAPPHAFRVPFLDETNGWLAAERLVPAPGHVGEITLTEKLDVPGATNPDAVFKAAMRRWLELTRRADRFTWLADGAARVAVRGDQVIAAFPALASLSAAGRVTALRPAGANVMVTLDERFEASGALGARFLNFAAGADGMAEPSSTLVPFNAPDGGTDTFALPASGPLPGLGDIVQIGPLDGGETALVITRIEAAENMAAQITAMAAAPEIDAELAEIDVPVWIGRPGTILGAAAGLPAVPLFDRVTSGIAETGEDHAILVAVRSGPGSDVAAAEFDIRHRLGAAAWTEIRVPAADASALITAYADGQVVDIAARAIALSGATSAWTATLSVIVGTGDAPTPAALVSPSAAAVLGGALVTFGVAANTDEVRIYRHAGTGNVLDEEADLKFSVSVVPGSTYQTMDGDGTRANLMEAGGFETPDPWTAGTGWTVASGLATKTAGTESFVEQAATPAEDAVLRCRIIVNSRTAGSVRIGFSGGAGLSGTALTAAGTHYETFTAPAGLTSAGAQGDAAFAGVLGDLVIFEQTPLCLPQGQHEWWLRPFNDGIAGPLAGPFTLTLI